MGCPKLSLYVILAPAEYPGGCPGSVRENEKFLTTLPAAHPEDRARYLSNNAPNHRFSKLEWAGYRFKGTGK